MSKVEDQEGDMWKGTGAAMTRAIAAFTDKPLLGATETKAREPIKQVHPLLDINNSSRNAQAGAGGSSSLAGSDGRGDASTWSSIGLSSSRSVRRTNSSALALAGFPGVEVRSMQDTL